MSYTISKDFEFSASHVLSGLPEGHPCGRVHGHNFVVRVVLEAEKLNEVGFVLDYRDMSALKEYVDGVLDHRHLNDIVEFNPTSENMCRHLFYWCKDLRGWPIKRLGWSETPKTWAYYSED